MKTLNVVELSYRAVIYAEESCHVRDAIKLQRQIVANQDPDDARNLGVSGLEHFDQDDRFYCVESDFRTISEILRRDRLK
jgi:hypothetical protein